MHVKIYQKKCRINFVFYTEYKTSHNYIIYCKKIFIKMTNIKGYYYITTFLIWYWWPIEIFKLKSNGILYGAG